MRNCQVCKRLEKIINDLEKRLKEEQNIRLEIAKERIERE